MAEAEIPDLITVATLDQVSETSFHLPNMYWHQVKNKKRLFCGMHRLVGPMRSFKAKQEKLTKTRYV